MSDWKRIIINFYRPDNNWSQAIKKHCFLPKPVVELILSSCNRTRQSNRIQYLSLDIFKLFLHMLFIDVERTLARCKFSAFETRRKWDLVLDRLSSHFHLRAMSCIEIASKMENNRRSLRPRAIRRYLEKHYLFYELRAIIHSTFLVFRTIRFKVPVTSGSDGVELLLHQCTPRSMIPFLRNLLKRTVANVLKFTYLSEKMFYRKVIRSASRRLRRSTHCRDIFVDYGLLVPAALVHCAGRLVNISYNEDKRLLRRLGRCANSLESNISALSSILYILILE